MKLTRGKAWEKLNELMGNKNLIKHCLAVEAAMIEYADYFDVPQEEQEMWRVAGLIHDADYEKFPDQHPQVILEWLKEIEAGNDLINAVAAHGFCFDVEAKTLMAKTLRAVDELTGLIVAVALVHPNKLDDVDVNSVTNKWPSKNFAAGVNREEIERGAEEIGVPLEEHIAIVLRAMKGIRSQLGL